MRWGSSPSSTSTPRPHGRRQIDAAVVLGHGLAEEVTSLVQSAADVPARRAPPGALEAARAGGVHGRAQPRGRRAHGRRARAGRAHGAAHRDRAPGQLRGAADPRRRQRGGPGRSGTRPRTSSTPSSPPAWRSCWTDSTRDGPGRSRAWLAAPSLETVAVDEAAGTEEDGFFDLVDQLFVRPAVAADPFRRPRRRGSAARSGAGRCTRYGGARSPRRARSTRAGIDPGASVVPGRRRDRGRRDLDPLRGGDRRRGMTVSAPWSRICRRCAELRFRGSMRIPVHERFADAPLAQASDEELYPIVDETIDLGPLARDAVVLELPAIRN